MSKHSDLARDLFKEGYNCSQAIVLAFSDETGLDKDTALKMASPFGLGMAKLREVCGAVSGMFMVVGLLNGFTDPKDKGSKSEHYKVIRKLAEKFQEENGSIICKELLGLTGEKTPEGKPIMTKKPPCKDLVVQVSEMLDAYIEERKIQA